MSRNEVTQFWRDPSEISVRSNKSEKYKNLWKFTGSDYVQEFGNTAAAITNNIVIPCNWVSKNNTEYLIHSQICMRLHKPTMQQSRDSAHKLQKGSAGWEKTPRNSKLVLNVTFKIWLMNLHLQRQTTETEGVYQESNSY